MLKIKSIINIKIKDKDYDFYCDPDAPLADVLEANNQINAFILGRVEQAKNAQAAQNIPPVPEMPNFDPVDLEKK